MDDEQILSKIMPPRGYGKKKRPVEKALSEQKVLSILQARFGKLPLPEKTVNFQQMTPSLLNVQRPGLRDIFRALKQAKRDHDIRLEKPIMMRLLGITPHQIKDQVITMLKVRNMLERDNDPERAEALCQLARESGSAGMNLVMEWLFEHGRAAEGIKSFNNRKKWGIPVNEQTYVIYFSRFPAEKLLAADTAHLMKLYDSIDKPTISIFNACLETLLKDHKDGQTAAWEFFDRLAENKLYPTTQTFTIFLKGLSEHVNWQRKALKEQKMTQKEKEVKMFELQGRLVGSAREILDRLLLYAIPTQPDHPNYEKDKNKWYIDIDTHLARVFCGVFTAKNSGTSYSPVAGSHYAYISEALEYLKLWLPAVQRAMHFARPYDTEEKWQIQPSEFVREKTDERIRNLHLPFEFGPQQLAVTEEQHNPTIMYPTVHFSPKESRHFFSGKLKLVDFTRPLFADYKAKALHRKYMELDGKKGKKLTKQVDLVEKAPINLWLMGIVLDGLAQLGLLREFYLAMWHFLSAFGLVKVDKKLLREMTKDGLPKTPPALKFTPNNDAPLFDDKNVASCIVNMCWLFPRTEELTAIPYVVQLVRAHKKPSEEVVKSAFSGIETILRSFGDPLKLWQLQEVLSGVKELCEVFEDRKLSFDPIVGIVKEINRKKWELDPLEVHKQILLSCLPFYKNQASQSTAILNKSVNVVLRGSEKPVQEKLAKLLESDDPEELRLVKALILGVLRV